MEGSWHATSRRLLRRNRVTPTKGRPIDWQDWSADGRFLMFLKDETGDENQHLFAVDPMTHAMRGVAPLANINVGSVSSIGATNRYEF
jgi:acylaminoacyl-peptidase